MFAILGVADWRARMPEVRAAVRRVPGGRPVPRRAARHLGAARRGLRVSVIANQPTERGCASCAPSAWTPRCMAMSEEMGVAKPDAAFFVRALELMGGPDPGDVAYVGDRPDNDVRPAAAAGMRAVWLRRGPWGVISAEAPGAHARVGSLTELVDRLDEAVAGSARPAAGAARVGYASHARARVRPRRQPPARPVRRSARPSRPPGSAAVRVGRAARDPGRRRRAGRGGDAHRPMPAHGDLASNLAMKLARPLRRPPMAIAEAIAAELRRASARAVRCRRSRSRRPGSSTCVLATGVPGADARCGARRRRRLRAAVQDASPRSHQRGVRVRQPDRAADGRQRPRRVRG